MLIACLLVALAQEPSEANPFDPTRFSGKIVALRTLVAPEGGLPEESLEPLLRVQQDSIYSPADVRQDIAMLHRALDFAQVEVHVEPWVSFDEHGDPIEAVRVEYRVVPPPRLVKLVFAGNHELDRRALLGASGMEEGDPFFSDDAASLERAIREAYATKGYPRAAAAVTATVDEEKRLTVHVDISEGEPQRIEEIKLRGGGALTDPQMRWILARAGLREGRPWTDVSLREAREALTVALRKKGWYEARVGVRADPVTPESDRLAFLVDPRSHWEVERDGRRLPRKKEIERLLALTEGARLGHTFAEEATRTLTDDLREKGFLEAEVAVAIEEDGEDGVLRVTGDARGRHRLRDVVFAGDTVHSQRYLSEALRQASPEVLGRGRVTERAIDKALAVLEDFYRSEGYLGATLERTSFTEGRDGTVVPVDVGVDVKAGPRTVLLEVEVPDVVEDFEEAAFFSDLVGEPINPAEVEVRSRRLVEALNERGYLTADAHIHATLTEDRTGARVLVEVVPGPIVYLRTVLIRGHRRTRRSVIEREVTFRTGDPLSPSRITGIRRGLYELNVFSRVDVSLVGDEDRVKDLIISVEEKPNLHFELGGGVATDQGLKVFARGGHRNLFGLGHRVTLLGQAGLGWVGDGWAPAWLAPEWKAAGRYEAPHIPARGERLAADVIFNEQQQEPTFRMERTGGGVGVLLRLGNQATAEVAYRAQLRRLLDVDPGALVAGDPWLDDLSLTDLSDPRVTVPSALRPQSGVELSLLWDRRDDAFNPTRGGLGSLFVNFTDEIVSDVSFLRGEGSWSEWVPLGGFGLHLRARGGIAWVPGGGQTLPLEDRFRLGGGANLRGFDLDSVGPANEVPPEYVDYPSQTSPVIGFAARDADLRWVPTGGDSFALATVEFRIPFEKLGLAKWSGTQLALFTDVGNAWFLAPGIETDSMATDPLLRWSVGVGLRRATVIGPVQVDVGFNPMRLPGRDEALVRLHVSLGAI